MIVLALLAAFPIYWLVITALKPPALVQTDPPIFFTPQVGLQNFRQLLAEPDLNAAFRNSIVVALGTTATGVIVGSMAAFSLSKTHLAYGVRRAVLIWILVTRIFPPVVMAIPYFTILKKLGLTDTQVGLIITHASVVLPFVVWLMVGFFQDLPEELDKAAMLDGCSMWRRYWQVALPLLLPAVAVTSLFAFILSWNEYLYASILTSNRARTLPVLISSFIADRQLEWSLMAALGVVMLLPVAIFTLLAQRYLVRGLTFGAVKE